MWFQNVCTSLRRFRQPQIRNITQQNIKTSSFLLLVLVQIDAQQDGHSRRASHRLRCVLVRSSMVESCTIARVIRHEFGDYVVPEGPQPSLRSDSTAVLGFGRHFGHAAVCGCVPCAADHDTAVAAVPPRVSLSMTPQCAGVRHRSSSHVVALLEACSTAATAV